MGGGPQKSANATLSKDALASKTAKCCDISITFDTPSHSSFKARFETLESVIRYTKISMDSGVAARTQIRPLHLLIPMRSWSRNNVFSEIYLPIYPIDPTSSLPESDILVVWTVASSQYVMASHFPVVLPSPIPKDEWTLEKLKERLRIAMKVELSTIPLYMYALYSIKEFTGSGGQDPRVTIRRISIEEMDHLALAGNILRALNAVPVLYDEQFIPTYPTKILISNIPMNLEAAEKPNILNFVKIEAPYPSSDIKFKHLNIPDENSIGEFYENIKEGIKVLSESTNIFANPNTDQQFNEFRNTMIVNDKDTAFKAIKLIIEQGEGGPPPGPDDGDSHYKIFSELYKRQPQNWTCHDVVQNPKKDTYDNNKLVKHLALAFDAVYCYLLMVIEQAWKTKRPGNDRAALISMIRGLMMTVLKPLAVLIVGQKFTSSNGITKNAGPRFSYYPTDGNPTLRKLYDGVKKELGEADRVAEGDVKTQIAAILANTPAPPA